MALDTNTALKLIAGRPCHHDFEVIPGVRTHGTYAPSQLGDVLDLLADLSGMPMADAGASHSYLSLKA